LRKSAPYRNSLTYLLTYLLIPHVNEVRQSELLTTEHVYSVRFPGDGQFCRE